MNWTFDVTYKSGREEQLIAHGPARAADIRTDLDKMKQGGGGHSLQGYNHRNKSGRGKKTPYIVSKANHGRKYSHASGIEQSLPILGNRRTFGRVI